jgi:hypothetical protein
MYINKFIFFQAMIKKSKNNEKKAFLLFEFIFLIAFLIIEIVQ